MPIIDLLDPSLYVTDAQQKVRVKICKECPYIRKRVGVDICFFCTCVISLKTKLKTEKCPIEKWKMITD